MVRIWHTEAIKAPYLRDSLNTQEKEGFTIFTVLPSAEDHWCLIVSYKEEPAKKASPRKRKKE